MPTYRLTTSTGRYSGTDLYTLECMADEDHPGYGVWEPVFSTHDGVEARRLLAERQAPRPCTWPLSHRDVHSCSCVCVLPPGHAGPHRCAVEVWS